MNILVAKTLVSLAALLVLAGAQAWLRDDRRAHAAARWLNVPACWFAARLLPWLALYLVAGVAPHSDVATAFWPQARAALAGAVPYRDFECYFSPLFPHLLALPLLVWRDPRALILFLSALEAVTVALTLRAAQVPAASAARARTLAFYFLAPGPLLLAVVGGQEDFLLWLGGLLVWLAWRRYGDLAAGLATVGAALVTKPLFALPAVALLGASRARPRFLAAAVPAALAVLAALWALTGRAFLHVLHQSENLSPPNVWIWLHWLSGGAIAHEHRGLSLVVLGVVLAFGAWYFARHAAAVASGPRGFFAAWTVLFVVSMLLNLKSMGAYLAYFALPALVLCSAPPHRGALAAWLVLGSLAPVESSLWYRTGAPLLTGLPGSPLVALDYLLQGVMLACLVGLGLAAHRRLGAMSLHLAAVRA